MHNTENFLGEGYLTQFTPAIKSIASGISGDGVDLIFNVAKVIKDALSPKELYSSRNNYERLEKEHQARTADEILRSDYFFGCSDEGLVFVTLARYLHIPSKYIQCVDVVPYMKNRSYIHGHVYAECFVGSSRYLVDPSKGLLKKLFSDSDKRKLYKLRDLQLMVEAFSGLDNWEAGVRNNGQMLVAMKKAADEYLEIQNQVPMAQDNTF